MNKPQVLKLAVASTFAISASLFAINASALTATANLGASANVVNNCTIAAGTALSFGAYDPVGANAEVGVQSIGSVSVTCTLDAAATVTLSQGANPGPGSTAAVPLRQLKNTASAAVLSYTLYQTNALTDIWGDTDATGVDTVGTGSAVSIDVFGEVAAGQNQPVGNYADTVVATITF
ncbi:N/A [soil metagenome]